MINKVKLWGQLKQLTDQENIEIPGSSTIEELIIKLAGQYESISHFLVKNEKANPSILVFINETQHIWGTPGKLNGDENISIMSPIAGG